MRRTVLVVSVVVGLLACNRGQGGAENDSEKVVRRGAPPLVTADVSMPEIPDGPPFVGEDGVDLHGYPLQRPDSTVLFAMLKQARYEQLDAAIEHYQGAFETDFHKEAWPGQAMGTFAIPDAEVGQMLDAWNVASPRSFSAKAARGVWHTSMGWKARGDDIASKTSPAQFSAQAKADERALADFALALELRPSAVSIVQRTLQISRSHGDDAGVQRDHALAEKLCPECFDHQFEYVLARGPIWGGSAAAMELAARSAPVAKNSKLATLAGASAFDRCRALRRDKKPDEAVKACAQAERAGAHPRFLCERAAILVYQERYLEALRALQTAVRLDPQAYECLKSRAVARGRTADVVGAAADLLTLRRLNPYDDRLNPNIDWMMKKLRYDAQEAVENGDAATEQKLRALADSIVPGAGSPIPPGGVTEEKIARLQAQVAEAPKDLELHLRLDAALAAHRRFDDIISMWNGFLETNQDHARALQERGGAKWHGGDHPGALADVNRACTLGAKAACSVAQKMRRAE